MHISLFSCFEIQIAVDNQGLSHGCTIWKKIKMFKLDGLSHCQILNFAVSFTDGRVLKDLNKPSSPRSVACTH